MSQLIEKDYGKQLKEFVETYIKDRSEEGAAGFSDSLFSVEVFKSSFERSQLRVTHYRRSTKEATKSFDIEHMVRTGPTVLCLSRFVIIADDRRFEYDWDAQSSDKLEEFSNSVAERIDQMAASTLSR